jgi:hypothetical protein
VENRPRPVYREGYYTDEELQTQSLEAWRTRLRAMHDYIPDRMWDNNVHLDRVKILQAALSSFKKERESGNAMKLHGRTLAEYPHGRYESLQKQYRIPQEVCPPKELMGNLTQNEDILYRFRCCPVNRYYSMLLEDTPGYVANNFKPKSHDFKPKGNKSKDITRYDPASSAWMKVAKASAKEPPFQETADLSERSAKNMFRPRRRNPIAGEETGYSSESGNEFEDINNSRYDHRLVPADKRKLADWEFRISKIRQQTAPQSYIDTRTQVLNSAEEARLRKEETPIWLHDSSPPWNEGTGLAITRYDEMMVDDFKLKIAELRERNASLCVLEDAAKKRDGPRGQGHR